VREVADRVAERFGRIDVWINCAAVTAFAPFEEIPLSDFRRILEVNIMGYVHGARAVLPHLRDQGKGILINVSSIVSSVPQPYTQAYSMSKAAVRVLGASLRQELQLDGATGVKVCTVLPATIDTPFFEHAANYTGRKAKAMPPVYSAERVARTVVDLVRVPRREVIVGPMGRNLVMQAKLAPGLTERMMAMQVDRTHLYRSRPASATDGNLSSRRPERGPFPVDGMVDAALLCVAPHLPHWSVAPSSWRVVLLGHVLLNECAQGVGPGSTRRPPGPESMPRFSVGLSRIVVCVCTA
jgi:short-subunit dehydrogenase